MEYEGKLGLVVRGERAKNAHGVALLALVLGGCAAEAATSGEGATSGLTAESQSPAGGCVARPAGELPAKLSQLGCFDGDDPRWPAPSTIAFSVNAPLFTDGADKERFFAVPEGARIDLDERGDFVLPAGSVLVKSFSLGATRVETRVLMNDAVEGWHGASYRWNADGTDAELAPRAGETLAAVGETGQPWTIPSRGQCFSCHTGETHMSLGLEVAQLNRDFTDPHTGDAGNQLDRLIARGLLDASHPTLAAHSPRPRLTDYHDAHEPIEARARAYLHGNCSSCHSEPAGFCTGDFRAGTPGAEMGVCNVAPKLVDPSSPMGTLLLAPGDPERSAIVQRMRAPDGSAIMMPPIGRHAIDEAGLALVSEWIRGMQGCQP